MIDVYITHHLPPGELSIGLNDFLFDEIRSLRRVTSRKDYRLTVIYYAVDNPEAERDLYERMPWGTAVVRNDRPGFPDSQPSKRNKAVELACASEDTEFMVLLHNDVRVAKGWLDRLVQDLEHVEQTYGQGSAIISPRYVPYHRLHQDAAATRSAFFWERLAKEPPVVSIEQMAAWCRQSGFRFDKYDVQSPPWCPPGDDGHQLMMWIARPQFFDKVGLCDEAMRGGHYDDSEWGMRALMAGKRNCQSRSGLIGHVMGMSFKLTEMPAVDNGALFVAKWGRKAFDDLISGALWLRLHREQQLADGLGAARGAQAPLPIRPARFGAGVGALRAGLRSAR